MILMLFVISMYYVDQPYVAVPGHAEFEIELRFGPQGEILGFFDIGVMDRLSFGISYGANNLLGAGDPEFYEIPGVQGRIIAIEQGLLTPRVILGFDSQGYGGYDGTRYTIRSKGLYSQIGKAFGFKGIEILPSLGVNYCFEGENHFDLFCGLETMFGSSSALIVDYTPNFEDDLDQNNGYLNTSLKLIFYQGLFFEFALRDLLGNSPDDLEFNRMIRIGYKQIF